MIYCYLMETFTDWLELEINGRHWRIRDLAEVSGIPSATLSRVLNGTRGAGPEVCVAIARGLGYDPVFVFRKAGLLPPARENEKEPRFDEMREIMKQLTPEERGEVLAYAIWKRDQRR